MVQFFLDYGLFLAKVVTVGVALTAAVFLTVGLSRKETPAGGLTVEKLNDKYRDLRLELRHAVLTKARRRKELKQEKKQRKVEEQAREASTGADGAPDRHRATARISNPMPGSA